MWPLFASVGLASLLGSGHCVGMCGPLAILAAGSGQDPTQRASKVHAAYHGGRALAYATLGLLFGALGSALDLGGAWLGIQRGAMLLSALALIAFGLNKIALARGWRVTSGKRRHAAWWPAFGALNRRIQPWPQTRRALGIGVLSGALPCGWLYAFVAVAAASAHPLHGAGIMLAFWLGTVPLLGAVSLGARRFAPVIAKRLPLASACMMVAAGLSVLWARTRVTPALIETVQSQRATVDSQDFAVRETLERAITTEPECCAGPTQESSEPQTVPPGQAEER